MNVFCFNNEKGFLMNLHFTLDFCPQLWNSHTLFTSEDDAEKFEGILDTIFLLAYATVNKILNVVALHVSCYMNMLLNHMFLFDYNFILFWKPGIFHLYE